MLLSITFSQNGTEKGGHMPTPHRTQHGPSALNTGRRVASFRHLRCCLEMFWESSTQGQSEFSQGNSRSMCDQTLEDISGFGKTGECPAFTGDPQQQSGRKQQPQRRQSHCWTQVGLIWDLSRNFWGRWHILCGGLRIANNVGGLLTLQIQWASFLTWPHSSHRLRDYNQAHTPLPQELPLLPHLLPRTNSIPIHHVLSMAGNQFRSKF